MQSLLLYITFCKLAIKHKQMTKKNIEVVETQGVLTVDHSAISLIEQAIEQKYDIEKLERLFDLQKRWEENQAKKDFNEAFSQWLAKKPEVKKTKSGYQDRYRYAPLPEIQKAVDPVLSSLGFSYRFNQTMENNQIKITCILTHIGGHSESSALSAPYDTSGSKNAIQSAGSTVTYLQRYTLVPLLGINVDDDDDGQSHKAPSKPPAQKPQTPPTQQRTAPPANNQAPPAKKALSEKQLNQAIGRISKGEQGVLTTVQQLFYVSPEQLDKLREADINSTKTNK
jgi:hypothetical protein